MGPKDAKTMAYVDKKCPFTGNVSIRGRLLTGVVTKLKMQRSCTVRRDYLHYIKKYQRFEKRHKMVSAHVSPCWRDIAIGDLVTIGECRPLAKTMIDGRDLDRDLRDALSALSLDAIINMTVEEFNAQFQHLSREQLAVLRDIRRTEKNREAARRSREHQARRGPGGPLSPGSDNEYQSE